MRARVGGRSNRAGPGTKRRWKPAGPTCGQGQGRGRGRGRGSCSPPAAPLRRCHHKSRRLCRGSHTLRGGGAEEPRAPQQVLRCALPPASRRLPCPQGLVRGGGRQPRHRLPQPCRGVRARPSRPQKGSRAHAAARLETVTSFFLSRPGVFTLGAGGAGAAPALSPPSSPHQTVPVGRSSLQASPRLQPVPNARQLRAGLQLHWRPYAFNKIRQIGPGDRDCSKPVIKHQNPGQCKRQQGPSWKGPSVPALPRSRPDRCEQQPPPVPRGFLSRLW